MSESNPRSVTPLDLAFVRRVLAQQLPLDVAQALTRGGPGMEDALLSTVPLADLGAPTLILRDGSEGYVGQFRMHSGSHPVAHLTFLAPEPRAEERHHWTKLLEALTVEAGRRGAHLLSAEVGDDHPAFEALRLAGFAVYARQMILRRLPRAASPSADDAVRTSAPPGNGVSTNGRTLPAVTGSNGSVPGSHAGAANGAVHNGVARDRAARNGAAQNGAAQNSAARARAATITLRPATEQDGIALGVLVANTVPRLLQQAEPPPEAGSNGLVYTRDGELAAFLAVTEGRSGIVIKPHFHPEVYDQAADIIAAAIPHIPRAAQVPLYVYARAYQDWLRGALAEVEFEPWAHQALMVKYTLVRIERPEPNPLTALEPSRLRPPVANGPLPLHKQMRLGVWAWLHRLGLVHTRKQNPQRLPQWRRNGK